MSEKEIFLTREGKLKLENELIELRNIRNIEIPEKIKAARSFGDLSENAEYDEAKAEEAYYEERIRKLEERLKNAQIIDESSITTDKISLGSKVRLYDREYKEEVNYTIVGSVEADPLMGFLSNVCPVGSALIGRKKGDVVEVITPGGVVEYEVLDIGGKDVNNK